MQQILEMILKSLIIQGKFSNVADEMLENGVRMVEEESFESTAEYYATLFHEIGHATGHGSRLNREGIERVSLFSASSYSKEELIAEITSAFLCAESGIDGVFDNSASYIAGWVRKFKDKPKMVVRRRSGVRFTH